MSLLKTIIFGIGMLYYTIGIRYWDLVGKDWKGILCITVGMVILFILNEKAEWKNKQLTEEEGKK